MKIGLNLPQAGALAHDPAHLRTAAVAAEQAGYDSVWVLDRILGAVDPRTPYPGTPDGALPTGMETVLDPIGALTVAAMATERVRLGASVLVAPWYPPVLLARSLTTLDLVSKGRLVVGLGTGWSVDEYESVGVPISERGARLDETLDVLDAVWSDQPVVHEGHFSRIAPSIISPKPTRRGGPEILLGGFTPKALDRVALRSDGWTTGGLPPVFIAPMWNAVRDRAAQFGRNGDALRLVVRANIHLTERPVEIDRAPWTGTPEQVAEDIDATRRLGAHELIIGVGLGEMHLDDAMAQADEVADAAGLPVRPLRAMV